MPSFNPVWHTPVGGWSRFSNPVPWTTKGGGQGQGSKGQGEKDASLSESDRALSTPDVSVIGVTRTWARPDPRAMGVPVSMATDTLPQLSGFQFITAKGPAPEYGGPNRRPATSEDENVTSSLLGTQKTKTDESETLKTRTSDAHNPEPQKSGTQTSERQNLETQRTDTSSQSVSLAEEAVAKVFTTFNPIVRSEYGGVKTVTPFLPSLNEDTGKFDYFAQVRDTAPTTNSYGGNFHFDTSADIGKARSDGIEQLTRRLQPSNTSLDGTSQGFQQSNGNTHQTNYSPRGFLQPNGNTHQTSHSTKSFQQSNGNAHQTSHPPESFQHFNESKESTLQTSQSSQSFPQPSKGTHQTSQSSQNFHQASINAFDSDSRNDTDSEKSLLPPQEDQTVVNTTGVDQNSSEPPQSAQSQEEPLVITKLEDLHDSELDSDLLYKAVEINEGVTNSTNSSNASDSSDRNAADIDNNGNTPLTNVSHVPTTEQTNGTSERAQFHLPDDDCLYDVYGTSGKVKFPDAERFPVFSSKEFITCRWRVRVAEGPNIKVSVERLALSLGVEQLQVGVACHSYLSQCHACLSQSHGRSNLFSATLV